MKKLGIILPLLIVLHCSCNKAENKPETNMNSASALPSNLNDSVALKDFTWWYEPKEWKITNEGLQVKPDSGSDFWQRTHYGFRNDNAHFIYKEIEGDFEMSASVSFSPMHRYDQAGLCVRLDEDNWLKTSAEYETEKFSHLGAVVTNLGYSDWSTQEIPADVKEAEYKIVRKGQDFEIYARYGNREFQQIRIAHLHKEATKIKAGMYACSPTAGGYSALFKRFELKQVMNKK